MQIQKYLNNAPHTSNILKKVAKVEIKLAHLHFHYFIVPDTININDAKCYRISVS